MLALWWKWQVRVYRVQPKGTVPDLWGFGKGGGMDSVSVADGSLTVRQHGEITVGKRKFLSEEAKQRALSCLRPPWPKGVSGNPGGKPKKVTSALDRALNRHNVRRIAYALIGEAAAGNVQAFTAIRETIEGPLPRPVQLSGPDGGPIKLAVVLAEARQRLLTDLDGKP
jgi:hypothetical protein